MQSLIELLFWIFIVTLTTFSSEAPDPTRVAQSVLRFKECDDNDPIEDIIEHARESHEQSRFGYIPFSSDKVRKIVRAGLDNPKRHGILLAYKGDRLVGFAYCSVGEYHIGSGVLLTTIHNVNVAKDVRANLAGGRVALGLFKGLESWSKARGAKEVLFHVSSGVELARAHKLAKRMGFAFIGGSYAKSR